MFSYGSPVELVGNHGENLKDDYKPSVIGYPVWNDIFFHDDASSEKIFDGVCNMSNIENPEESNANNSRSRIRYRSVKSSLSNIISTAMKQRESQPHLLVMPQTYKELNVSAVEENAILGVMCSGICENSDKSNFCIECSNKIFESHQSSVFTQPFEVNVHPQVSLLCDIHAHLSTSEVIGLLAGKWVDDTEMNDSKNKHNESNINTVQGKKRLYVQAAFPCVAIQREDGGQTDVELDPAAELLAREAINSLNLTVVGWYHSHPRFKPHPSVTDICNQQQYQRLLRDSIGIEPFVGLIISTFDIKSSDLLSEHKWFHVIPYISGRSRTTNTGYKHSKKDDGIVYIPVELHVKVRQQLLRCKENISTMEYEEGDEKFIRILEKGLLSYGGDKGTTANVVQKEEEEQTSIRAHRVKKKSLTGVAESKSNSSSSISVDRMKSPLKSPTKANIKTSSQRVEPKSKHVANKDISKLKKRTITSDATTIGDATTVPSAVNVELTTNHKFSRHRRVDSSLAIASESECTSRAYVGPWKKKRSDSLANVRSASMTSSTTSVSAAGVDGSDEKDRWLALMGVLGSMSSVDAKAAGHEEIVADVTTVNTPEDITLVHTEPVETTQEEMTPEQTECVLTKSEELVPAGDNALRYGRLPTHDGAGSASSALMQDDGHSESTHHASSCGAERGSVVSVDGGDCSSTSRNLPSSFALHSQEHTGVSTQVSSELRTNDPRALCSQETIEPSNGAVSGLVDGVNLRPIDEKEAVPSLPAVGKAEVSTRSGRVPKANKLFLEYEGPSRSNATSALTTTPSTTSAIANDITLNSNEVKKKRPYKKRKSVSEVEECPPVEAKPPVIWIALQDLPDTDGCYITRGSMYGSTEVLPYLIDDTVASENARNLYCRVIPELKSLVLGVIALACYYREDSRRVDLNAKWKGVTKCNKIKSSAIVWTLKLGLNEEQATAFVNQLIDVIAICWHTEVRKSVS